MAGRKLLYFGAGSTALWTGYQASQGNLDPDNLGPVRFGRAAYTVGAIGLDYKKTLSGIGADAVEAEVEAIKSACHQRAADRMLKLCCDNGGCFIKVGQHIGALDYLLPEEYVSTMKVLHHRAPEMSLADVYDVIREDLKVEPTEVFSSFDEKPLGTASLAQVHRATLKSSGQDVAVKVQHRHVKNHSLVDIATMTVLVKTVKIAFPQFEFMWLADEMRKNLPLELSFTQEGLNAEKCAMLLDEHTWLKIPEIHWGYTTDRVLTMEYCKGGHVNDLSYLRSEGIDPHTVSANISQMYADMIFKLGFVHCDPHPGNILVSKDSDTGKPVIALLDHGLYTQLTYQFRQDYAQFWLSILNADKEGIKATANKLGIGELFGLFACMVSGRSWSSIEKGIDKSKKNKAESKEIKANAQRYIREIADVLAFVNRQMILIFKTNDLLRGIEHSLGTHNSMNSFIQMSRACFRCLNSYRYKSCNSSWCRFRTNLAGRWDQLKISFYQVFLWMFWSRIGQAAIGMLAKE